MAVIVLACPPGKFSVISGSAPFSCVGINPESTVPGMSGSKNRCVTFGSDGIYEPFALSRNFELVGNGGSQEFGKRAGTENMASIVGMATAIKEATDHLEENAAKVTAMRNRLIDGLKGIERSRINGDLEHHLPGTLNMCFEGIEGESLLLLLDAKGICASSGSACTSGSLDPSHVLLSIGVPVEIAHGSLRLSISEYNTMEQMDHIVESVPVVVDYLRSISPVWEKIKKEENK
mgnify:CR=1 FL=1